MEDKLKNSLDQLNEEQTSDLIENNISFDIDRKAIARIKTSTFNKIRINKKPSVLTKKFIACAVAAIFIFCTSFALNFDSISAAVKQAIDYIPGFGRVSQQDNEGMLEIKVMKAPVFVEVQGQKVEIYSCWLSINKDQVIVTAILRYPRNLNLNGEVAIEYNKEKITRDSEFPDFSTLDAGEKNKEMTYSYTIRNPKFPINTLTFITESSKVDIPFEKSKTLIDKVISQNFGGIIVSAIPLNEERSRFILTSTYEKNMKGVMFISSLETGDSEIKAIDEAGNEYEIKKSTSLGSEYYVEGNIKEKIVCLKFKKLYQGFSYEKNKSLKEIKFKVPQVGEKLTINKLLDNSVTSIKLKTVEGVSSTAEKSYNLIFTYEMKSKITALDIYNIGLYVEKTGGVMAGTVLEKHKEENGYMVKYGVLGDKNAADNTVNIIPYGSYYSNMLLLDKECILKFQ